MFGSSTGSADNSGACFFFRFDFLVGHGTSGCDCQGNYSLLVKCVNRGSLQLTGALNVDLGTRNEGEEVAKLAIVCGVGGELEAGIVCEDSVEEGVCGGGGWYGGAVPGEG